MRSLSVLASLIASLSRLALPQSMTERDAVVEHKAFAAPAALRFRHPFQIFQDSALEVIDLAKAASEQIGAGLLAADAAGAEHRDPAMPGRIEMARGKILELPKALDAGIDRAREGTHCDLERIAGVDHKSIGCCDQRIPVGGID